MHKKSVPSNRSSVCIQLLRAAVSDFGGHRRLDLIYGDMSFSFSTLSAVDVAAAVGQVLASLGHPVRLVGDGFEEISANQRRKIEVRAPYAPGAPGWQPEVVMTHTTSGGDCDCCGGYTDDTVVVRTPFAPQLITLFQDGHLPSSRELWTTAMDLWRAFSTLNHPVLLEQIFLPSE